MREADPHALMSMGGSLEERRQVSQSRSRGALTQKQGIRESFIKEEEKGLSPEQAEGRTCLVERPA